MRHFLRLIAACCVACTATAASACMMSESDRQELFARYDSDHDGKLTAAEYNAGETSDIADWLAKFYPSIRQRAQDKRQHAQDNFKQADAAGRGYITVEQFPPGPPQKCS
ncbi:MAG: EF-hand domain-containing protein [Pseudomonadota bacterium]